MKKISTFTALLFIASSVASLFANSEDVGSGNGVSRYAVYVGSNYGGTGRERLLYAGSDALNFKKTMMEIGGVSESSSRILIDPTKEEVDKSFSEISDMISKNINNSKRSEFIFYYSGHSDENSLLLGNLKYDYSKLKAAITEVPSDIHVVILDSCYSGNFIRTKGGQRGKPFLLDDSTVVSGHAYLSSSSEKESSQESDEIESSFFTNAMITGLRGAADTSGDNKVTLNELYSYAFNETLSKTENSKAGPQHPNYNITLVGSGDLVISDISSGESMLSLPKDSKGRFIIRDANNKLVSEINKVPGQSVFMALPSGKYSAVIIDDYSTMQGTFILERHQVYLLDKNSLISIQRKRHRVRGKQNEKNEQNPANLKSGEIQGQADEFDFDDNFKDETKDIWAFDEEVRSENAGDSSNTDFDIRIDFEKDTLKIVPFHFSFVPGVSITGTNETSLFSLGIVGALDKNVCGVQTSLLVGIVNNTVCGWQSSDICSIAKNVKGAQTAGLFNTASGNTIGVQAAGLFNIGSQVKGLQSAGLFNVSSTVKGMQVAGLFNSGNNVSGIQASGVLNIANKVSGIQVGLINIANENTGITIGLINIIKNGIDEVTCVWNTDNMLDMYLQMGTRNLYTTLGFAFDAKQGIHSDFWNDCIPYIGFGRRTSGFLGNFDTEILWKNYFPKRLKNYNFFLDSVAAFRYSWNIGGDNFAFKLGWEMDIFVKGRNDKTYSSLNHNLAWEYDKYIFAHSFFFGVKI